MKKKRRAKAKPKAAKKKAVKKPSPKRSPAKKTKKKAKKGSNPDAKPARPGVIAPVNSVLLGFVEDYFAKIGVVALTLKSPVSAGQRIQVLGHTTNLEQRVESMQIDHLAVTQAASGDGIGIKVIGRARAGDHVYLLK